MLLHLLGVACSANNTTGMFSNLPDTGVLGGRDAQAQTAPCTQWDIAVFSYDLSSTTSDPVHIPNGSEPFAVGLIRRCTAH